MPWDYAIIQAESPLYEKSSTMQFPEGSGSTYPLWTSPSSPLFLTVGRALQWIQSGNAPCGNANKGTISSVLLKRSAMHIYTVLNASLGLSRHYLFPVTHTTMFLCCCCNDSFSVCVSFGNLSNLSHIRLQKRTAHIYNKVEAHPLFKQTHELFEMVLADLGATILRTLKQLR